MFGVCLLATYLVYTMSGNISFTPKMTRIRLTEYKIDQSENGSDQRERRRQAIRPAALSTSANLTWSSNSSETPKQGALLTLFTTFKESSDRNNIQTNTILNWASLGPKVQPLVFTNLSSAGILVERARKHGWIIAPLQRVNKYGTPFLKDMFRAVTKYSGSPFYGYCNADILFGDGLVKTLEGLKRYNFNSSMLIGRRVNVKIDPNSTLPLYRNSQIVPLAKSKGSLFRTDAEDYFIIGPISRFPWHMIKDVVIGRPAYDNYLVGQALIGNVSVVDATKTVLAVHQTGKDGIHAGARNKDGSYNKRVIGRYNYNSGLTSSAKYVTIEDVRGDIFLQRRRR